MPVLATANSDAGMEVRRLKILYELLADLSGASTLDEVFASAIRSLLYATSADRAAILLFDEDGVLGFAAWHDLSENYRLAVTGHSPWPRGTRNAEALVFPDVLEEQSLAAYRDVLRREGIRALALIPLELADGVFGKLMLYYNETHTCSEAELEISRAIAGHVALATNHKRMEMARNRSERQLQSILDNTEAVVFLKDIQGRYTLVNQRFEELFHIKASEAVGRTDEEMFPPEIAGSFQTHDRAVLAQKSALTFDEYAPHDDGIHAYVCIKFPLEGADGSVSGIGGIATDITERKKSELVAKRLAAIVESSDDAIIGKDSNGIITSWNPGAERLFGYPATEAIGKPVSILAPPEKAAETSTILARVLQGGYVEHFETRRRTKDGRTVEVAVSVSPIRDASGQIVGASKIARDITDRKAAERERSSLLEREREARQTAEILNRIGPKLAGQLELNQLVQDVTDIATGLVGAEFGSFFHNVINEKGESYLLYTLSGAPREAFAGFPMPRNTAIFAPTFAGKGVVRCDDVTQDPRYGHSAPHYGMPTGHLPVHSYLAVPVTARSGEVLGGLFFGHSVAGRFTAHHEEIVVGIAAQAAIAMDNARLFEQAGWAQNELKRSNEDLRRANRDLEIFAYSASHDLQEPLRTISISSQLIQRGLGADLQGDTAVFLSTIISAADRMSHLIQDLIAYSAATKPEAGPTPRVEPAGVLADVTKNLHSLIHESGARIEIGELPAVAIHESRLSQVFQNLIANAIKYRTETPRVSINAAEQDGWCVFSVTDNGIGIESQYAERIFELFKRLHAGDRYPGSGIGLSICQRVVEQYGGRIWLERSEPGKGSTFCFSVPVCR